MNDDYPALTISQVDALEALAATGLQPKSKTVGDALAALGVVSIHFRTVVAFRSEDILRHSAKPVYSLTDRGRELARVVDVLRSRAHSKSVQKSRPLKRSQKDQSQ
jgi:hypothetical protein